METKGATFNRGQGRYGRAEVEEMDFKVETYIDRKMEFIHVDPFKKMCKESDRNETTHDLLLETRSPPLTKGHDHSNGSGSFELDGRNSFKFHLESSKSGFVAESENPDRTDENTRRPGETLTADDVDDSFIDHKMEFIFVGPRPKINAESRCIVTRSDILRDTMPCDVEPATMKGHPGNDSKPVHHRGQDGTDGRRNIKSDLINKESMRLQTSFELPVGASPFTAVINPVKLPEDDSGARNGQDIDFGSNGPGCGPCEYGRASSGSMSIGKSMTPDIGDKACRVSVLKGTSGQDLDKNPVVSDRTSVSITDIGKYPSEDHGNETCIESVAKGTLGAVLSAPPRGNESTSFDTTSIRKSLRAEIEDETFIDRKMEVILFEPFQKIKKGSMRIQTSFELLGGESPFTTVIHPIQLTEDDSSARNGQDIDSGSNGPGCGPGGYGSTTSGSMSMGKSMTPDIGDKACRVSVLKGTGGHDLDKNPVASGRTSVSITGIATFPSEVHEDETCIESVAKGTLGAVPVAAPRGNESTSFNTTSIGKSLRAEIGDETFIDRKMEVILFEPFKKINKGSMGIQTSFELPVGGSPFSAVINPVKLPENDSSARNGQDIDFEHKVPVGGSYSQDHDRTGLGRSLTAEIGDETYTDRKMEFIHVDNFEKVKVRSSTICYDS